MSNETEGKEHATAERIARENAGRTRRELIEKLESFLQKGYEQAYQLDKSLLTLSAGALLLSVTFVGTLSEAKHWLGFLFAAWGCFAVSIVSVIFAMQKAQWQTHANAIETSENLERFSQMEPGLAGSFRATFTVGTNKRVRWLNRIAILSFVFGVAFLCSFVGINLLANRVPLPSSKIER